MNASLRALLLPISVVTVLVITPAAVSADPIVLTLNTPSQSAAAGSLLSFQGSFSNAGVPASFINSISLSLVGSPAGFTFDANEFFAAVPLIVDPGFTVAATNFFSVLIDLSVAPGLYSGSFSVLGGVDEFDENVVATHEFTIQVDASTSQVPEPATLLLFGTGLSWLTALARKRGRV